MNDIATLLPPYWSAFLKGGRVNIGVDVGSTVNKKSNPTAICLTELYDNIYWQRLVTRFKTEELSVIIAVLKHIASLIPPNKRGVILIDNSNEKFAARQIRKALVGFWRVVGIGGGNKVTYLGETSDAKTALGSAYCAALEDGLIAMASEDFIKNDHRQVTRNGSRFDADVDAAGNHADIFDASKLSFWGFISKGHLSEGWKPAATTTFYSQPQAGGSAIDRQRGRLHRARIVARRRTRRSYFLT